MAEEIDHTDFKLKYGGTIGEIDVTTFLQSLDGIVVAIEEVNKSLVKDRKIQIKVKAPERGSLLVHLSVESSTILQTLMSYATLDNLYKVVVILGSIITIKKALSGKKAVTVKQDGEDLSIETESGSVIKVDARAYKLFTDNRRLNDAIEGTFSALENDTSVTEFEMIDEQEKKVFESRREEFSNLTTSTIDEDERSQVETLIATINVLRLAFEEKYKWEFYHKGRKISARISDAAFLKRIDAGEQFAKGDSLQVRLKIEREFDATVNTYVDKSYEVTQVIKHIPRQPQEKLDLK